MTAPQSANVVSGLTATVGRYFAIVSLVPSLLLVGFLAILVGSGAWNHEPDWARAVQGFAGLGFGGFFVLFLAALGFGVILHPLQFALVQFIEGYWGLTGALAKLRNSRLRYHLQRQDRLHQQIVEAVSVIKKHEDADEKVLEGTLDPERADGLLSAEEFAIRVATRSEAQRLLSIYPRNPEYVMPTRLGNVLRRHEMSIGKAYGLSIIDFAPHLMLVAPPEHSSYVNDQRTAMDLAVRTCLVCILGSMAATLFLWQHGLWLLVAAVPYLLAIVSYRGAVVVAQEYGAALRMLLDLNRFSLYERMHLRLPTSTDSERTLVKDQLRLLTSEPSTRVRVSYRHPPAAQ